jgi:hypothetical protein
MYYGVTRDDDDERADGDEAEPASRRWAREDAPKERVLHTRVPAVLDQELKRLATSLRVPVSNVVRAILEDALDAVDTVGERAEGGLLGFVDRLARQRDELRSRVQGAREEDDVGRGDEGVADELAPAPPAEALPCPLELPEVLQGVFGYQPIVLATETRCTVCGRALPAGGEAHRALFDDPGKRVFLGPECRLLPEKGN